MKNEIKKVIESAEQTIKSVDSIHALMQLKSKFIGKKSELTSLMKQLGSVSKEERPEIGKILNSAKQKIQQFLQTQEQNIKNAAYNHSLQKDMIDITMPGRKLTKGGLHPITKIFREIEDNFISMGFDIAEAFDVEDEYHNFDALNTPADHPARDLSDTFYVKDDILLRTHTSPVQIRVMEKYKPPIKIIAPGRCYRNDNDASHSPAFHQVEALVVGEGINFADLRDVLNIFVKKMFGDDISSRIRPHFFPFTEPSAEIDIACVNCGGKGCNICKNSGWLELGGAGMVDPNVFDALGIDSEKYTGYAFGMGIDRVAVLKYNIPDMRMLFENDIRFLKQFS
ncbi:MAG: phenylalanine--tRNA ligase subunit alpha [Candidatus Cloacimonetes bacterium]|nr:phenylalanine--tRNA ligase subunit alpha [Candidatus Cloacimonadota bacterium]